MNGNLFSCNLRPNPKRNSHPWRGRRKEEMPPIFDIKSSSSSRVSDRKAATESNSHPENVVVLHDALSSTALPAEHPSNVIHYQEDDQYAFEGDVLGPLLCAFVGFANISYFPKNMRLYGGVYYTIPYLFWILVYSVPVVFIELHLAQYTQLPAPLGQGYFAPILKPFLLADYVSVLVRTTQTVIQIAFSLLNIFRIREILNHKSCANSTNIQCTSLHDDLECLNGAGDPISEFRPRYMHKTCHNSLEREIVPRTLASFPITEMTFANTDESASFFNYPLFFAVLTVSFILTAFLSMPIRYIARFSIALQFVIFSLFFGLIIHLYVEGNHLISEKEFAYQTIYPRAEKLWETDTWVYAASHAMMTMSLGNSHISSITTYSERNCYIVKWLLPAVAFSFLIEVMGAIIALSLEELVRDSTAGALMPGDLDERATKYLIGTVPQVLTYFENADQWVVVYYVVLTLLGVNSLLAFGLHTFQVIKTGMCGGHRIPAAIINIILINLSSFLFLFPNMVHMYDWMWDMQHYSVVILHAIKQIVIIGCYGSQQIRFDVFEMLDVPTTRLTYFYDCVTRLICRIYFTFSPVLTLILLSTSIMAKEFDEFLALSPFTMPDGYKYAVIFLTPNAIITVFTLVIVMCKYCSISELFRVQPQLPSYERIRVGLTDYEENHAFYEMMNPEGIAAEKRSSTRSMKHLHGEKEASTKRSRKDARGSTRPWFDLPWPSVAAASATDAATTESSSAVLRGVMSVAKAKSAASNTATTESSSAILRGAKVKNVAPNTAATSSSNPSRDNWLQKSS